MSLRGAGQPPRDVAIRFLCSSTKRKQHFGQIRRPLRIRLKCYFLPAFSAGRGLPRRFAPRNDRGRYALVSADTLPPSACHCEERGNRPATWQSALFAVARNEKQHFGQIVGRYEFALSATFCRLFLRDADCRVASLLAMTGGGTLLQAQAPGKFLRTLRAKHSCTR